MAEKQENPLCVLAIGEFAADRLLLHDVCRSSAWQLIEARDRRHAMKVLDRKPVHVVIAETDLPHWSWKNVLSDLRRLPQAPQLIVTSRTADDYLWAEVLNLGGYDVLPQPLQRDEVERVVAAARRQYVRPASRPIQSSLPPGIIPSVA
jgi:response regulator RpfG family c-di-GMP phosphodiesterase